MGIAEIIREVAEEMCSHYCKYPHEWDPEGHDGVELADSDICENCPLNRLD